MDKKSHAVMAPQACKQAIIIRKLLQPFGSYLFLDGWCILWDKQFQIDA